MGKKRGDLHHGCGDFDQQLFACSMFPNRAEQQLATAVGNGAGENVGRGSQRAAGHCRCCGVGVVTAGKINAQEKNQTS